MRQVVCDLDATRAVPASRAMLVLDQGADLRGQGRTWGRDRMALYRAAYGLAGANAYSADGEDGHFAWCVAALDRPEVRRALERHA